MLLECSLCFVENHLGLAVGMCGNLIKSKFQLITKASKQHAERQQQQQQPPPSRWLIAKRSTCRMRNVAVKLLRALQKGIFNCIASLCTSIAGISKPGQQQMPKN